MKSTVDIESGEVIDPKTGSLVEVIKQTDFARMCGKSPATIHGLTTKGNSIRKLRCIECAGVRFIPKKELHEYPFKASGASKYYYTYDENMKEVPWNGEC